MKKYFKFSIKIPHLTPTEKLFLMSAENLEMENSLKWVLFIKISGQIASDTLWK